jgi:hypothetical protein
MYIPLETTIVFTGIIILIAAVLLNLRRPKYYVVYQGRSPTSDQKAPEKGICCGHATYEEYKRANFYTEWGQFNPINDPYGIEETNFLRENGYR